MEKVSTETSRLSGLSKQETAYNAIKEAIIREELKPNQMLSARMLCAGLSISRTPVMEALKSLSYEGFLETIPDKGVIVTSLRPEDYIELYQFREGVEGIVARLCAERRPESIIQRMELCMEEAEAAYKNERFGLTLTKDNEFHVLMIGGAGNRKIIDNMRPVLEQSNRGTFVAATEPQRIRDSICQHRNILNAIRAGDPESAEECARFHMRDVSRTMKNYMEKYRPHIDA